MDLTHEAQRSLKPCHSLFKSVVHPPPPGFHQCLTGGKCDLLEATTNGAMAGAQTRDPVIHGKYQHSLKSCHCSANFPGLAVYYYYVANPSQLNDDVILKGGQWLH